jgi:hypothetical protein
MELSHPFPESENDETLPCGADLDELQARGIAPVGHEHCPHCLDALAALRTLGALVRHALEQEDQASEQVGSLADRIMRTVRTEMRPGPLVSMGDRTEDLWITHAAAARVVRRVVDALPGISAGGCRITPFDELQRTRSGRLPRGPIHLRLEIAISPELVVAEAGQLVRDAVGRAVRDDLGLDISTIDLAVVDLIVSHAPRERGPR